MLGAPAPGEADWRRWTVASLPAPADPCTWATCERHWWPGSSPARRAVASWSASRTSTRPRSRDGHARAHLEDLAALGLDWDGPVLRQSRRAEAHLHALALLEAGGDTYPCYCTRREVAEAARAPHGEGPEGAYPGTCRHLSVSERHRHEAEGRRPALRLATGGARVAFVDGLAGPRDGVLDDFVIRRRNGGVAYNLAVVVDDAHQGIEQVVRGDDLLATTPRQIHLAHRLGLAVPAYAHVPLVLGADGQRLAKRHGAVTLADRRALGQRSEDVLALLAVSLGLAGEAEAVTPAGLLACFDPHHLGREPWTWPGDGSVRP